METNQRIMFKAITWQVIGLVMMTMLGYALTGSLSLGGGFALISAATGLVMYVLHERAWSRVSWGRTPSTPQADITARVTRS